MFCIYDLKLDEYTIKYIIDAILTSPAINEEESDRIVDELISQRDEWLVKLKTVSKKSPKNLKKGSKNGKLKKQKRD